MMPAAFAGIRSILSPVSGPLRYLPVFLVMLVTVFGTVQARGIVYHGNENTRKFHEPGCRHYNCPHCVVEFNSRQEALDAGYEPCKVCDP